MGENLLILIAAALPLMGSPGPAVLSTAAVASAFGIRACLPWLAGIVLGTATVLGIVASGVAGMVLAVPVLLPVVSVIAALWILWLAWKIATAPPLGRRGPDVRAPSFAGAYLLAIANPKAYAAIGAVYANVIVVAGDPFGDAVAKVATLSAVIVVVNSAWMLFGAAFARVLSSPRLGRAVNIVFALLLVASVVVALLL
ncbi:MAG: LysE family transporter [Pseudomonadota bacterium]|nr:LysE family transporter [Pseudomonadota bacterium]